jgi:magnesium transporter
MITVYPHNKVSWIDVENPTHEDISELIKTYGIHPACAEELLTPTERAKVDLYDNAMFLVLHYPDHPADRTSAGEIEIDFIVMKDTMITVHYQPIDTLIEFAEQFKVASMLDRIPQKSGGHLFFTVNNLLYRGLLLELETVQNEVKKAESRIFSGHELQMVRELSDLHRKILDYKQSFRYHASVLKSFESQSAKFFGESFEPVSETIMGEFLKVENLVENERDLLRELRDTNDSLLTAKNNDVTKKLTLMAFVTFPLALVATVLLSPDSPQLFHGPYGFEIIVGILFVMFVGMHLYFTYKKWI